MFGTGCHLVKSILGAEKGETNDLVSDILEKVSGMLSCGTEMVLKDSTLVRSEVKVYLC